MSIITRRTILSLAGLLVLLGAAAQARAADAPASPWDLTKLSQAPAVTWLDDKSPIRALLYVGEPFHGKPTHVFAYYATPGTLAGDPSKDKNLPAIVLLHGGGGSAFKNWAEMWAKRGYAAIAMDLSGEQPIEGKNTRARLPDGGPDQSDESKFGHMDEPVTENWSYHAVANAILAHSLIRSLPGVDAERTAVTGISWGGYLTCIVASVDHRFKAAVPVYGCGFLHENSYWKPGIMAKMPAAARDRWVKLYDPSSYLAECTTPIFFVNDTNDFAYPLDSYMKSFDLVKCEKNILLSTTMKHGHAEGWSPPEIAAFVDTHLNKAKPLPHVTALSVPDGGLIAEVATHTALKSAVMHYTTDTSPINKRTWHDVPSEVFQGKCTAKLPADYTLAFFTVTDERDLAVTSVVLIAK